MKKKLPFFILMYGVLFSNNINYAQTNYSFPISTILAAGSTGVRLPNGTIVRVERVTTGIGVHSAASGTSNPDGMGGVFTGTSFLPGYTGSTTRNDFTIIETSNTTSVDNGVSNNAARSIGFRIYFDRPTTKISFLALDIDGMNSSPGNAEWITGFGFNGTTYVPYTQTINSVSDPEAVAPVFVNTTAPHNWRTMITNTAGAGAAANLPNSIQIQRAGSGGSAGLAPDNLNSQVLFNPTDPAAAVTDYFVLWGLWQQPVAANTQASGLSPIVVTVSPDFGDAPDSYQTLLASAGPSHGVVGTLGLGVLNNTKPDGTPATNANSDPDDDGISTAPVIANTRDISQTIASYSLTTSFFNTTGLGANYIAWVDWNNNGIFEASEAQTATSNAATTTGTVTFTWNNVTLTGTGGRSNTYARIRVTTEAITTADVGGAFRDGEVEDYLLPFAMVLPLKLVSFSGSYVSSKVTLKWVTGNESTSSHFNIERSADGNNFSEIGRVAAAGNSSVERSYEFTDVNPVLSAMNYYRLKQVDADGKYVYSSIIRIAAGNKNSFKALITPNPVTNMMNVVIEGADENEKLKFEMINADGSVVHSEQLATNGSAMIKIIQRPAVSAGIYIYRIIRLSNNETFNGKLILK